MGDCLLSIVICTFNRASLLDDALRSFAEADKSAGFDLELLVIDNNSGDDTRSVVERWTACSTFPIRYCFESQQGLSHARNRAVKDAAGRWLWYIDDDVYFSRGWLNAAVEGISFFPQASVLAGRVVLAFEPEKPEWLPSSLLPYYGLTSFGDELRWLNATEYPVGANAAFRRSVFDEVGLFREDLGRCGASLLSSEETDRVTRLYERGHEAGYVPGAEVQHRVPKERATMSWLRKRAYWAGISYVLTDGVTGGLSRLGLIREAARRMRSVGRDVLWKGLNVEDRIEYARQFGLARQYLAEATRNDRLWTGRSGG